MDAAPGLGERLGGLAALLLGAAPVVELDVQLLVPLAEGLTDRLFREAESILR
jgi:hypothetical protein